MIFGLNINMISRITMYCIFHTIEFTLYMSVILLAPKGLNVLRVTKPVWAVSLDLILFLDF
jgi:hypothetical protein